MQEERNTDSFKCPIWQDEKKEQRTPDLSQNAEK